MAAEDLRGIGIESQQSLIPSRPIVSTPYRFRPIPQPMAIPVTPDSEAYHRILLYEKLVSLGQSHVDPKSYHEFHKSMERACMANIQTGSPYQFTDLSSAQLLREFVDHRICKSPQTLHAEVMSTINEHQKTPVLPSVKPRETAFSRHYRDVQWSVPDETDSRLLRINPDIQTLCAMRMYYMSMFPSGQQLALPYAVFKSLVEECGVRLEAYASPLNSRMLELREDPRLDASVPRDENGIPRLHYCSVLPIDMHYGSIGNINDRELAGYPHGVFFNAPFVESIQEAQLSLVRDLLTVPEGAKADAPQPSAIVITPGWRDAQFHKQLTILSQGRTIRLESGTYFYEQGDQKVVANFHSDIHVLGAADVGAVRHALRGMKIASSSPAFAEGTYLPSTSRGRGAPHDTAPRGRGRGSGASRGAPRAAPRGGYGRGRGYSHIHP
jgi:hypothetical protein